MPRIGKALKYFNFMPPDPHYRPASKSVKKSEDGSYTIYPRQLSITWGRDERYWKLPSSDATNDNNYAELKQVCWLEVTGSTEENLESGQSYNVSFKISMTPDAFGWDDCNVYIMAKIGKKGTFTFQRVNIPTENPSNHTSQQFPIPMNALKIEVPNSSGQASADHELYFGMYEVWSKRWKGGLRIHNAFVQKYTPSNK